MKKIIIYITYISNTMSPEQKNKWSVIINIALTTITALLSALGFSVG